MTQSLDLDGLQELMWGFAGHRVITVAARNGVLSRLARGDVTLDELAAELELERYALGKVVRALTALGIVEPFMKAREAGDVPDDVVLLGYW